MTAKHRIERRYHGIGVSPGVVRAQIRVELTSFVEPERYKIDPGEVSSERRRLEEALVETRRQIRELQEEVQQTLGSEHASIFEAHLLVLEDYSVMEEVFQRVTTDHINIDAALRDVFRR